jgi:tetrahydromethanopterin S-methyltransferase subunit A
MYDGKQDLDKFRAISVTKKPLENMGVTPIHAACINPNTRYVLLCLFVMHLYSEQQDIWRNYSKSNQK